MAFNLRCRDSRMKYRFNSGISTPVIRSDDIPTLYPTECSICPRPRGLSCEWRRTIDDDYDKQSRCPRGFVLYRPSSRSSWPSSLLASPLLFSNYIIPTREPHTHSHTPYKNHTEKKKHFVGEGRLRLRIKLQFNILRRARDIFRDHARA